MTNSRKRSLVSALTVLLLACLPTETAAFIGFFERLSGPGPYFPSFQFPFDRLVCLVKPGTAALTSVNLFSTGDDAARLACITNGPGIRAYLALEISHGASEANDQFPATSFTGIRPIGFYRVPHLADSLDVGAGVGFNRFSGEEFGFWRTSVPVRARVFIPGLDRASPYRAIHLALQGDYFPMEFVSDDFKIPPGYESHHKFVKSIFLNVDLVKLFAR